ncbi:MAG TPA: LLM class F420-dependent oxidoreductase, partial [Actinobacteria bacterium]|nr:LLM class F420-dependent oxidoreductase [Actinomycetota bacterium]
MDIGIQLPTIGFGSDASFVLEIAQAVDRLGYHSVWTSDHVALSADRSSVYPYQESTTELFMTAGLDWLDPIAVMGFVAGCTTRVRIGVGALVVPYRNPVVLANMLASLDVLSNGRIILGAGVGWMDEEFPVGVPRQERGART